jgi:hypothetical protein
MVWIILLPEEQIIIVAYHRILKSIYTLKKISDSQVQIVPTREDCQVVPRRLCELIHRQSAAIVNSLKIFADGIVTLLRVRGMSPLIGSRDQVRNYDCRLVILLVTNCELSHNGRWFTPSAQRNLSANFLSMFNFSFQFICRQQVVSQFCVLGMQIHSVHRCDETVQLSLVESSWVQSGLVGSIYTSPAELCIGGVKSASTAVYFKL